MGERVRTLSIGVPALLAASAITLSAYTLTVAENPPPAKRVHETLVYLYKPPPPVEWHRWFTRPGSSEKFCGIADGVLTTGEGFGAAVPCTAEDLREDRQEHKGR